MFKVELAVWAACAYFFGFGAAYVLRPELADQLGLKWLNPAGRTEIRCYYGAVSWALAAFFAYLVHQHQAQEALTGVLLLASAVLGTRLVFTTVDHGWAERYTKMAIPIEMAFVAALALVKVYA